MSKKPKATAAVKKSVARVNPYHDLLGFASAVYEEELSRSGRLAGRREPSDELGRRVSCQEAQLLRLVDACLLAAGATGFSVGDVEQRVNALADPVRAIICWQLNSPPRPPAEDVERLAPPPGLGRGERIQVRHRKRRAPGQDEEWEPLAPLLARDPAGAYLVRHHAAMMKAWNRVHALAVVWVDGNSQAGVEPAGQSALAARNPPAAPKDGPTGGGVFMWKGREIKRLSIDQYLLLSMLWDAAASRFKDDVTWVDAADRFYADRPKVTGKEKALEGLRGRTCIKLRAARCGLVVERGRNLLKVRDTSVK